MVQGSLATAPAGVADLGPIHVMLIFQACGMQVCSVKELSTQVTKEGLGGQEGAPRKGCVKLWK